MNPNLPRRARAGCGCFIALLFVALAQAAFAGVLTLHLRNGDRISGTVVNEDARRVVLATDWAQQLEVPLAQIARCEAASATAAAQVKPAQLPAATPPAPTPKEWKVDAQFGLDLNYGFRKTQFYHARCKLGYEHSYEADAKQSFRNTFDYSIEYGEFKSRTYANRMEGSANTEFDLSRAVFGYNLVRGGYDEVRQVDYQFEIGPGAGWHIIRDMPNFKANVSAGFGYYQPEFWMGKSTRDQSEGSFYYRLAEDFKWQITPELSLDERFEFLPSFEDFNRARARFEANLRYKFTQHLSLVFTAINLYDTQPAPQVDKNELRLRSSLGVTF